MCSKAINHIQHAALYAVNQYSFYYQQKQELTQPQLKYLRQECDHYCPGRKLEWLIMEE